MDDSKIDKSLASIFSHVTNQVAGLLKSIDSVSQDEAETMIRRYTAAIEGNFLAWMAAAAISGRSIVSRFAAEENLWVEIKDDHPGMLHHFAKATHAEPNIEDFGYVQDEVDALRKMTSELSGLKNITLMAALENTSAAFIPYLAGLAKRCGAQDLTYTNIHGEADIKHANQFLEALTEEQKMKYENPKQDIDEAITLSFSLLKKVFTV